VTSIRPRHAAYFPADSHGKRTGFAADEKLLKAFEREAYSLKVAAPGTYRSENPAHRLSLNFDRDEVRISHPGGRVSIRLAGFGYGDKLRKPRYVRSVATANRLEYRRGDLTEWYANTAQGLEQGFTFARRPGAHRDGEPLVIAVDVAGDLVPTGEAEDGSILLRSHEGVILRYSGLEARDAHGRNLPARLDVKGAEIRLMVDDRDAEYPVVVDPTWTQQQELIPPEPQNYSFGTSVSIDGDTAIIGAPVKLTPQGEGVAYVYILSGDTWTLQQELPDPGQSRSDSFGYSVSLSGNTAVIGAYGSNGNAQDSGVAYVFIRNGTVWTQQAELISGDGATSDEFGYSVSVSGNTAIVGAPEKNNYAGAAYAFVRNGSTWMPQQEWPDPGTGEDRFGFSVSVGGTTALIGANTTTVNSHILAGAAYVSVQSGSTWSRPQELTANDAEESDQFGAAVAVNGDTAVIGAVGRNEFDGVAYVFTATGGEWSQQQELAAPDPGSADNFGVAVAVDGNTAVIGAQYKTIQSQSQQGAAYVFMNSGGVWSLQPGVTFFGILQPELTANDIGSHSRFGNAVGISGNTVMIGAQGAAYVEGPGANALLVGSSAGTSSVALDYSGPWSAQADSSFLQISPGSASGNGNARVQFTYAAFTGAGSRAGSLTVAGLPVPLTQAGANYLGPGGMVTLPSTGLGYPGGAAADSSGNIYIADLDNETIEEWNAATQQYTTLIPTSAGLSSPADVALDGAGNVYIADDVNDSIEVWSPITQQLTQVVQSSAGLNLPTGVAVDGVGNIYIADPGNFAIEEWSASTQTLTTLVRGGETDAIKPYGVAVDGFGNVYIADANNNAIEEWVAATQKLITLISGVNAPNGIRVDAFGNLYISVSTAAGTEIEEWNALTSQLTVLIPASSANKAVAVDGSGNVYVASDTTTFNSPLFVELLNAFAGPATLIEPPTAGTDSLLPVLPSTATLTGVYAPISDQGWLTIGTIANGVVSFSFTANTSSTARTAHISLLGQQVTVIQNGPVLSVAKSHTGNFTQGQNGATYAVTVSNQAGAPPTSGTVTVTETAPSGLTLVSMSGTGWACGAIVNNSESCTNSNALAGGASYPTITVTVNVAANAPTPVVNQVSVSGGGSGPASAIDPTIISVPAGAISIGSVTVTPGAAFNLPVTISLNASISLTSFTFGAQIAPNAGSPALTGSLAFSSALTSGVTTQSTANSINATWSSLNPALSGTVIVGYIIGTVPLSAVSGNTYTVQLTTAGTSQGNTTYSFDFGPNAILSASYTYLVGDVYPYTSDAAPNFGSGQLTLQDLVLILFAANNVPGYRPTVCSDRFDAMDTYPVDTVTTRGGDGVLDIHDVVVELFRVNNLDQSRPVRASRGGVCPASITASVASTATIGAPVQASLGFGTAEKLGRDEERIPVYLEARADLTRVAITFAVGDGRSNLRFAEANTSPPLAQGEPGAVAVAWTEGLSVQSGHRILLGYVVGPAGVSGRLAVYGLSASSLEDNREIPINTSGAIGMNR
jgi:hypothetical protein